MSKGSANTSHSLPALLLGLAATFVAGAMYLGGLGGRLESLALDMRFRHLTTAPAAQRIVHIDIDDTSLKDSGRWPWPREQIAGMIDVLNECGARAVALDIIMPEPQKVRYESDTHGDTLGEIASPEPILDDRILAQSIRSGGNVLLPMYVELVGAQSAPPLETELEECLTEDPNRSARGAAARVASAEAGDANLFDEVLIPSYFHARAMNGLRRFSRPLPAAGDYPLRTGSIIPPFFILASATRQTGFVTFVPESDGVIRRIPLLMRHHDAVFPQFALAVAADDLSGGDGNFGIAATASAVTLRCPDGAERVIPIDANGCMLINWMKKQDEQSPDRHLSAGSLVRHWRWKHELETSPGQRVGLCDELVNLGNSQRAKELQDHLLDLYPQRKQLRESLLADQVRAHRQALLEPDAPSPDLETEQAELTKAEERIRRIDADLVAELQDPNKLDLFLAAPTAATVPSDKEPAPAPPAQTKEERDAARAKVRRIVAEYDASLAADRERKQWIEDDSNAIRSMVAGKICIIGSTATGAADFVPTPMNERMPGVQVHANIVNTILSGAFVRRAGTWADLAAILLAGLVVTLLASRLSVIYGAPAAALAAAAYIAFNSMAVFHLAGVWLTMVAPLTAMALSFLVVTAYRQLTEERAKRQIRGMFAHALSPALVDKLIENPSLARLGGEKRVLSCFFSDLAGFTPLSEGLGEQATVRLLNRYFDHMTEVIQNQNGGYLNKFLGDGLFVFFGAPVLQDDHAARAVTAALECQRELAIFNETLLGEMGGQVKLVCRIGVATGEVMVGNCGSTQKFDYTAIGDTVNLASRLEGANKFFGTRILIEDETWRQAKDKCPDILCRPLGKILVVGKNEPVAVWNPMGLASSLNGQGHELAEGFARAMDLFAGRQFAAAGDVLESVLSINKDDKPAAVYLALCRQYSQTPPGADWDGAIRLTEK